jgi:hypothetical protein
MANPQRGERMKRYLRLLLSLPLLATTACAADAIAGPELAPEPQAITQAAPGPHVMEEPAPPLKTLPPVVVIRCAGSHSARSGNPLFLIDGVPASSATVAGLDANRIHSIQFLKGESLAALYGRLHPDGVVIITTRTAATRRR